MNVFSHDVINLSIFLIIGGGFGGKEIRCDFPYVAVAVAANT